MGIRGWQSSPRECLKFSCGGLQVEFGNRSTATPVQVRFVASKCDKKRAGCTIIRTRLSNDREMGGLPMEAFEVQQKLLDVHPQVLGGPPLTVRATLRGWRVFTTTEAVTALQLMREDAVEETPCSLRYTREESEGAPRQRRKVFWSCKSRQEDGSLALLLHVQGKQGKGLKWSMQPSHKYISF